MLYYIYSSIISEVVMMKKRLSFTKTQKLMEALSLLLLIGSIIYLMFQWPNLPERLITHYNSMGQPDSWGGKESILFTPIMSIFLYLILTGCLFLPQDMMNTPVAVTKENEDRILKLSRDLLSIEKLVILCDFSYITFCTMNEKALSPYFLPIFLASTFIPVLVIIVKMVKCKSL